MVVLFEHETVLRQETVDAALPDDGTLKFLAESGQELVIVDCTLGGGGHSFCALETLAAKGYLSKGQITLIGIDRDETARKAALSKLEPFLRLDHVKCQIVASTFAQTANVLSDLNLTGKINGLFADFGVSSPQLDVAQRGFSLRLDGPLDMRMDNTQTLTARHILEEWSERELTELFRDFGEEPKAKKLAHAIFVDRPKRQIPLESTVAFAAYVERVLGYRGSRTPPATRIFQALRIAVNDELGEISTLLESVPLMLAPIGRAAFISFHSLEDRLVKRAMRAWEKGLLKHDQSEDHEAPNFPHLEKPCWGREEPRGGIVPTNGEIERNPRAHSARLRTFCFNGKNRRQ